MPVFLSEEWTASERIYLRSQEFVMFAFLSQDQANVAWNTFVNFGAIGVIAFCSLGFVAIVVWTIWTVAKKLVARYLPELIEESITTIKTVRVSQEGILESQRLAAVGLNKLAELGEQNAKRDEALETILRSKMDPRGTGYTDHVFSSTRVEEFLKISLDLLESWLEKDTNNALKLDWKEHIRAMRLSLERKGSRQ